MSRIETLPCSSRPSACLSAGAEAQTRAELLVFCIGSAAYGIALRCVEGIRHYQSPTRSTHNSPQLLGLPDWRNETVPLLDLRCRLNQAAEFDGQTAIIQIGLLDRSVGVIVDRVTGPVVLNEPELPPLPPAQARVALPHALGQTWAGAKPLVLLDIEALLRAESQAPHRAHQARPQWH